MILLVGTLLPLVGALLCVLCGWAFAQRYKFIDSNHAARWHQWYAWYPVWFHYRWLDDGTKVDLRCWGTVIERRRVERVSGYTWIYRTIDYKEYDPQECR